MGRTGGERQTTKPREEIRSGLRPRPQPSWKAKAAAKSARDIGAAPAGSSGWATLEKLEHVPYLLDTGATSNIMSERIFTELQDAIEMEPMELDRPIRIVQADGSTVLVRRTVTLEATLETSAGPYDLGRVAFRIIPGEGERNPDRKNRNDANGDDFPGGGASGNGARCGGIGRHEGGDR